jgi:hypothetical protein
MIGAKMLERAALLVALVAAGVTMAFVPAWGDALRDVCHHACIGAAITMIVLARTHFGGRHAIAIEQGVAALFLAGMPLVYVIRFVQEGGAGAGFGWLGVEIAGVPVYAGLAALGLRRSPWFLVAGIVAHGAAWDSWHWLGHSAYVPAWYAIACLVCDVTLGAYLALRVPAWREQRREPRSAAAVGSAIEKPA